MCGRIQKTRRNKVATDEPGVLDPRRGQLEPPCEHRVDDDPVALQLYEEELAAAIDPLEPLPDERGELRGRAADGERPRRFGEADGTARERGIQGFGDDREVGEFGHGRDCSRVNACARLSRPREAGH